MLKTIEFYWGDLSEKKQKEIMETVGDNCNWDVYPIATLDIEVGLDIYESQTDIQGFLEMG